MISIPQKETPQKRGFCFYSRKRPKANNYARRPQAGPVGLIPHRSVDIGYKLILANTPYRVKLS